MKFPVQNRKKNPASNWILIIKIYRKQKISVLCKNNETSIWKIKKYAHFKQSHNILSDQFTFIND